MNKRKNPTYVGAEAKLTPLSKVKARTETT